MTPNERLKEIEGRLVNYKVGGADNVSTLYNRAPADIAFLLAELKRLNAELVDSHEANSVLIEGLKREVNHMKPVFEAAKIYMDTEQVGPLGTSRCKAELFNAVRKARETA